MKSHQEVLKAIEQTGDLPSIPVVIADVLRLTDDPEAELDDVAELVSRDPALTAKLLRISNSAHYGMRQNVGTVKLALVVLGMQEVRNIALGVAVFDAVQTDKAGAALAGSFHNHSFAVGAMARKLGTHAKAGLRGEDFVAGLLHDIGKMILSHQMGEDYEAIYSQTAGHGSSLCVLEMDTFGFTHAQAAAALATKWNLPETLTDALLLHHPLEEAPISSAKDPRLVAAVRIADAATNHDWSSPSIADDNEMTDDYTWSILAAGDAPTAEARVHLLQGFFEDVAEAPPLVF
jgi:putative nucleotidyltransferase with HDIG domain